MRRFWRGTNFSGRLLLALLLLVVTSAPCAADSFNLGAAAGFGILGLSNAGVSGKTQVTMNNGSLLTDGGNLGVNNPGKYLTSGSASVSGTIFLESASQYGGSLPFTVANLDQAVSDANALSITAGAMAPTVTFGSQVVDATTINRTGSTTVVQLNQGINFTAGGDVLTLKGGPSDVFIINSLGNITLTHSGSAILLDGVDPGNVLFNITGGNSLNVSGGGTGAQLYGTYLTTQGNIVINGNGQVYGRLIAGGDKIDIVSDADVHFRGTPPTATPEPTSLLLTACAALAGLGLRTVRRNSGAVSEG